MSNVNVAANLAALEARIAAACARTGRRRDSVELVGVSKTAGAEAIVAAIAAGLRTVGENRVQEAASKRRSVPVAASWHLIGALQSNKARLALDTFDVVESIDNLALASRLERLAADSGRVLPVFVEINLGGEPRKHGVLPSMAAALLGELGAFAALEVQGLMAVPPATGNAEEARPYFRALAELAAKMNQQGAYRLPLPGLSMGMSADFEVAIEEGATLVRVGTALFGPRQSSPPAL